MDPLLIISAATMQIGARHLNFELTPMQQEIIKHKYFQALVLFSILYISTKSIIKSIIIVFFIYISINILFNETHKYNLLSKNKNYKKKYYETLKNI